MVLRIHGLATSESKHGLGRSVSGSVYPKEGGAAFNEPQEGAAWIQMPTSATYPAGAGDNASEAMEGPTYGSNTFANDLVYGVLDAYGLPVNPYPFLFVGKIYDVEARDPECRIKWSAIWNGSPIAIAEEGRDFLAPRPSDPGWSEQAQAFGAINSHLPTGAPTIGNQKDSSTSRRPIVAACRRYCFVYPDLPVGSSRASWDESVYAGLRSDVLPQFIDYDALKIGALRPDVAYIDGMSTWDESQLVKRRSVFPADVGIRCEEGTLVLTCEVYKNDSDDAPLLQSRQLTLQIGGDGGIPAEGDLVTVVELTLPVSSDSSAADYYYSVIGLEGAPHSITLKQYRLPPDYQSLLTQYPYSDDYFGWGTVLDLSTEVTFADLFPDAEDAPIWPVLRLSILGYFGSVLEGTIQAGGTDTDWDLISLLYSSYAGDISSYPQNVYAQVPKAEDAFGRGYGFATLAIDTDGNYENMVYLDKVLVRVVPELP